MHPDERIMVLTSEDLSCCLTLKEAVRLLLANNAVVNAAAGDDMNALHFCAMKGHVEPAKLILTAGGGLLLLQIHRKPMIHKIAIHIII